MISLMSQIPYVHLLLYGGLGSFMSQIPSVSVLLYGGLGSFMSQIPSVYIYMYCSLLGLDDQLQDSRLLYYLIREIKMCQNFNADVSNSFCTCTDLWPAGMISLTHQILSVHAEFVLWRDGMIGLKHRKHVSVQLLL